MKNLKEMWNKLKYWQRGFIIGSVFISILHLYLLIRGITYGSLLEPLEIFALNFSWSLYTLIPAIFINENFGDMTFGTFILLIIV